MLNKKLGYMLSNNPENTISVKSSDIRKKIRPILLPILSLSNKLNLTIVKNEFEQKNNNRPIIYLASHGFKDDVLNTILTIKDDVYIVFGNIDLFFNTLDGTFLWLYGTQLVDRYNKESRNAMKEKMNKIIEYGNNILIFSEATWNLSPNRPMEDLHWGFYDVAIKNNALIVPLVTHKVGKKCYSSVLKPVDLNELSNEDKETIYLKMKQNIKKAYDIFTCSNHNTKLENEIMFLLNMVESLKNCKSNIEFDLAIKQIEKLSSFIIDNVKTLENNQDIDELMKGNLQLVVKLLSRVKTTKKEVLVTKIRDIMATEKYNMYEKYPDYSYMKKGIDIYDAWDSYIKDTVTATPYFYEEEEKTTIFKDPLVKDIDEVMPWLKEKSKVKNMKKQF